MYDTEEPTVRPSRWNMDCASASAKAVIELAHTAPAATGTTP